MGLNRTSWKPVGSVEIEVSNTPLPMGLNRTSWKRIVAKEQLITYPALPMGLNRTSWKLFWSTTTGCCPVGQPYRWA